MFMKGLILCAGKGTRLQPLSYSQPKTLLPVANKPVLAYCMENLVRIGIKEIGIVLNHAQEKSIKEILGSGQQFGAQVTYIYQAQPKGIADAVKAAENFIAKESFLLLLGDNLIQESLDCLKLSLEKEGVHGSIMLAKVKNPSDYGIAEIREGRIVGLEEKPQHPKSDLAVIGAYAFDSSIFKAVHAISPSARGEFEITDAIQWLIDQRYVISYSVTEKHYSDVGNVERWLEANRWMLDTIADGKIIFSGRTYVENCTLIHPIIIGEGCGLVNSTIGPYVSIAPEAKIKDCHIENSMLLKGVILTNITKKITGSVFGQYSEVNGTINNGDSIESIESIEYILGDKSSVMNRRLQENTVKEKDET